MSLTPHYLRLERSSTCQAQADCPFIGLPEPAFQRFRAIMRVKRYNQGSELFSQEQKAEVLFLIRSGWVKLFRLTSAGRVALLRLVGPGSVLGLMELVADSRYQVSAQAVQATHMEYATKAQFIPFLEQNPVVAYSLLRTISRQVLGFLPELGDTIGKLPATERLLHAIQGFSEICGQPVAAGVNLRLPLTIQELADRIGYSREWTSRLLRQLEAQGLIQRQQGWITLTAKTEEISYPN